MAELSQMEKLSADIDLRLVWLWQQIMENEAGTFNFAQVGAIARAAYGQGYTDATIEKDGKLFIDNGLRFPASGD